MVDWIKTKDTSGEDIRSGPFQATAMSYGHKYPLFLCINGVTTKVFIWIYY